MKRSAKKARPPRTEDTYSKFRTRWRHVLHIDQRIRDNDAPNCQQLAGELEVSRRTILRDIDFMKYDLGAPLDYDAAKRGYVYSEPNWIMPNVRISEGELFALLVAEKALAAYDGTLWSATLGRVFGRMIASLPDRIEIPPQDLLARVDFDAGGVAEVSPVMLDQLARILGRNKTITMKYQPLGAQRPREYTVDPYVLRRMRGAWYMAARDHRSGHVPLFNLMRIRGYTTTGQTFDYEASGFDPVKYFKSTFGAFESKEVHHVAVEFAGTAAELVQERHWHSSQKLTPLPSGHLKFEMDISHLDDILPWVLSWGRQAKVLAPPDLKKAIAAEAANMTWNYTKLKKPRRKLEH